MLSNRVLFADPPDTDNPLMCLEILKAAVKLDPSSVTPIVLSPRVLDLKAKRYGKDFNRIKDVVGIKRMVYPLTKDPEWAKHLDGDMRPYFSKDADFSVPYMRRDAHMYMVLTAFRFASFFEKQGIPRSNYDFYWAKSSLDKVIVGLHHPLHVPDYSYDFNEVELEKYYAAENGPAGDERQKQLLAVCNEYIDRQAEYFGYEEPRTILHDFHDLIKLKRESGLSSSLTIGGPFPEALEFVQELPVSDVWAMAFYTEGKLNVVKRNFNDHLDHNSAKEFVQFVSDQRIKFTIVPTECCKGCPFQLDQSKLKEVFQNSPSIMAMIERFTRETGTLRDIVLFDWVAALAQLHPSLLPVRRVEGFLRVDDEGDELIEFRDSDTGNMWMCVDDHGYMKDQKHQLMRLMKLTLKN